MGVPATTLEAGPETFSKTRSGPRQPVPLDPEAAERLALYPPAHRSIARTLVRTAIPRLSDARSGPPPGLGLTVGRRADRSPVLRAHHAAATDPWRGTRCGWVGLRRSGTAGATLDIVAAECQLSSRLLKISLSLLSLDGRDLESFDEDLRQHSDRVHRAAASVLRFGKAASTAAPA